MRDVIGMKGESRTARELCTQLTFKSAQGRAITPREDKLLALPCKAAQAGYGNFGSGGNGKQAGHSGKAPRGGLKPG